MTRLTRLELSTCGWPADTVGPTSLKSLVSVVDLDAFAPGSSVIKPPLCQATPRANDCSLLVVHADLQGVWPSHSTPPASVDALLRPLTGLTGLALSYGTDELPAALARLSQLQWLFVHTHGECKNGAACRRLDARPEAAGAGGWGTSGGGVAARVARVGSRGGVWVRL